MVKERWKYVQLKHTLVKYKNSISDDNEAEKASQRSRTLPLFPIDSCKSEALKKSFEYRRIKLWNALPRDWDVLKMTYDNFKDKAFLYIISKRNDNFIF